MTKHPQDMPVERTVLIPLPDPKMAKALELSFVPTNTPALIPRRLFENVQGRDFDVKMIDRFYPLAPGMVGTPVCILYLLLDSAHEIHGFLWTQLDPFISELSVYAFSVDPEYDDGHWVKRASEWLFSQPFDWQNLKPRIVWLTSTALNQRMVITKESLANEG
jgi:hypothetical protein